jgi:hypothetical protein
VLLAWLLAEHGYTQGRVSDAALNAAQDEAGDLLGPHWMDATMKYVDQHRLSATDLEELAHNASHVDALLQVIADSRRPGFEQQRQLGPTSRHDPSQLRWIAYPPGTGPEAAGRSVTSNDAGRSRPPVALLVMAEHGVDDPVWDRPVGDGEPVDLSDLGVSAALVQRLRAWNQTYQRLALTDFEWVNAQAESDWVNEGLRLAQQLQNELPDIAIRYLHADDDRPLRDSWS